MLNKSVCGYDTEARQKIHERRQKVNGRNCRQPDTPWERRAPYDYHGCLAHADITFVESTGEIRRLLGVLDHNEPCSKALLTRLPSIPLHLHVAEVAMVQLAAGAKSVFPEIYLSATTIQFFLQYHCRSDEKH